MKDPNRSRRLGVYVLANDAVHDWLVAFLESYRAHNPDLPLALIPYDDRLDRVRALADSYQFEVINDASLIRLDELGRSFAGDDSPGWVRMFRKFFVFWGPFEYGLYLDCDIIVLDDLKQLLDAFVESSWDFCFFDQTDEYVYNSEAFILKMKQEYSARLFNAGYWGARRGLFSLGALQELAGPARAVQDQLYVGIDQSFLNYSIHVSHRPYGGLSDLLPDLAHHHWAAPWRRIRRTGRDYRIGHRTSPDFGKRLVLLHWAGYKVSPLMPYRNIFLKYRLRSLPVTEQVRYRLTAWLRYLGGSLWRYLKNAARKFIERWRPADS